MKRKKITPLPQNLNEDFNPKRRKWRVIGSSMPSPLAPIHGEPTYLGGVGVWHGVAHDSEAWRASYSAWTRSLWRRFPSAARVLGWPFVVLGMWVRFGVGEEDEDEFGETADQ
ncbi:hypothetical protein CXB51_017353 [Gossypium anomalum]|uniref:Uncharacterized protein n=1 Tax=Gossypium anomalum TaxID=47600 RepID=A0A8J6D2Y8_9ROSI|nr:hypothetical protein CXB51_017353 [Gossypium anomalum]